MDERDKLLLALLSEDFRQFSNERAGVLIIPSQISNWLYLSWIAGLQKLSY